MVKEMIFKKSEFTAKLFSLDVGDILKIEDNGVTKGFKRVS